MLDLLLESVFSRECKHWTKTSLYKPWETSQKTWRWAVLEIQCQYFSSFQKGISHLTVNDSMQTDWWHMKKFKYYSSTSRLYVTYYKTQDWKWFCVCMAINLMRMYWYVKFFYFMYTSNSSQNVSRANIFFYLTCNVK